jgi:hypothetical protein
MSNPKLSEVFELDGTFYVIEKSIYESRETYIERVYFILDKMKHNKSHDLKQLIVLSKVMANIKILGCSYSKSLVNEI